MQSPALGLCFMGKCSLRFSLLTYYSTLVERRGNSADTERVKEEFLRRNGSSWFSFPSFHLLLRGAPAAFIPPIIIYLETGGIATTIGSPWDCYHLPVCKTDLEYYHQNCKPCNSKPPMVYGVGGSGSSVPRTCSGDSWASEIQLSLLNTIPLTGWGNRSQGNPRNYGHPII